MTELLLRKQRLQSPNSEWKDDDYAVLRGEDVIGRIYRLDGGPLGDHWRWTLNHGKFFKTPRRDDVAMTGNPESLEAAKVEIKAAYEKWMAKPSG